MPDFTSGDIVEVRFVCQLQQQMAVNVFHWQTGANGGTGATFQSAINTLEAVFAPLYKAAMCNAARYQGAGLRRIRPLPITAETFSVVTAGVGTGGTTPLPKQTSGILTKRTTIAGRRGRGRVYVPFPSTAFTDSDGTPTTAYLSALAAMGAAFAVFPRTVGTGGNDTLFSPVVNNRITGLQWLITAMTVNDKWATQRRRGDYGRTNVPPF